MFHLVFGIVCLPYERFSAILSVSMQNSRTNFSDCPLLKRFEIEPNWSKYFKKVFHVNLQKSSNVGDIKPSKTLV